MRPPAGARVAEHESVPRDPTSSRRPPRSPAKDSRGGGAGRTAAPGRRLRLAGRIRGREPAQGPPAPARAGPPPALPTFPPASQPPRPRSPRPTNLIAEVTSGGPGRSHSQSRHSERRRRPMGAVRGRDFPRPSLIEARGRGGVKNVKNDPSPRSVRHWAGSGGGLGPADRATRRPSPARPLPPPLPPTVPAHHPPVPASDPRRSSRSAPLSHRH